VENITVEEIEREDMDEQIKQTRITTEKLKKGQEVINRNLLTVFEAMEIYQNRQRQERTEAKDEEMINIEIKRQTDQVKYLTEKDFEIMEITCKIGSSKLKLKDKKDENKAIVIKSINMMKVEEDEENEEDIEELMGKEEEEFNLIKD